MKIRVFLHLGIAAFILYLTFNSPERFRGINFLVFLPYLIMNLLEVYYVSKALRNKPQDVDARPSSVLISILVTIHVVFVALVPGGTFPLAVMKNIGVAVNMFTVVFIVWSLLNLKTNLTVLPEANYLVRTGPYKYIRHPLYLAYIVTALSEVLIYQSTGVLALMLLQVVLILMRAGREEDVLCKGVKGYGEYRRETFWFDTSSLNKLGNCLLIRGYGRG